MPLLAEDRARLRRKLLDKGAAIADDLAALLDGKAPQATDLLDVKPGETPVEKARRFLALVERKRLELEAGTYGRCQTCGQELSLAELDELPWAETCRACPSDGGPA